MPKAKRVLLIGWDAADWQIMQPLLTAGQMPVLRQLMQHGVHGNVTALLPILSPLLWTSIATGKRADKHGILGFVEPDPVSGQLRPVSSTSRRCKAIWNILTQVGLRTHVLGWFASHPAEPINGVCVSNLYALPSASDPSWPLQPGTVYPTHLEPTLAALRVYASAISAEQLAFFLPGQFDISRPGPVDELARAVAESITLTRAAEWILQNEAWDFLAIYYNAIDHVSHHFMPFYPPRREGISAADYELYHGVVPNVYRFHDDLLGQLLRLAGPDTTIVLVSDHGFYSDERRPAVSHRWELKQARQWHRPLGALCLAGPGIQTGGVVRGASILDITPTILTLLGQPVGEDMDGRALTEILREAGSDPHSLLVTGAAIATSAVSAAPPATIPSWETVPGEAGMHPAGYRADPWEAHEALQQLVNLGYINAPSGDTEAAIRGVAQERTFNLALHYLETGRPAEAIPHFEALLQETAPNGPDPAAMRLYLARCRFDLGQYAACRDILEQAGQSQPASPHIEFLLGLIATSEKKPQEALNHFLKTEELDPHLPALHWRMGRTYLSLQRWEDAERTFQRALVLDRDSAQAYLGLAHVALVRGNFAGATAAARQAVARFYQLAEAHYVMGIALARQNQPDPALKAFQTCLQINPRTAEAHRWLAVLHEQATGDRAKAAEHHRRAQELATNCGG